MRRTYRFKVLFAVLLTLVLLASALLVPSSAAAKSSTTIQLWIGNASMSVNGVQQPVDEQGTKPVISAGRTLLPIRAVIEAFGGSVAWEPSTSKITVKLEKNSLDLWIGKPQASLNGTALAIDSANPTVVPVIMNGRTMLPLRFVAESLGIDLQYDSATKKITLQKGSWNISILDSAGNVGSNSSIAVDANDKVHISYIDTTNGNLIYLTNASGSWVRWDAGSAGDHATGIAVDANGKCHIVYSGANGELKYTTNATCDNGSVTTLETGVWAGLLGNQDIAVDSNGKVHIVYYNVNAMNFIYVTNASGIWSTSKIVDKAIANSLPAYSASIGVDSNNKVHICYYDDAAPDSIKYATNVSGSWVSTTIDTIEFAAGWSTSLAVDSNDKIHILYYEHEDDALKYATNASGAWQTEIVDNSSGNVSSASIAIDKANGNQVHVVYGSASGFMYATKPADKWERSKIDESWTGSGNSIAIGPNSIHVSYKDGFKDDLKYAWKPLL
ncbi:MAG: stalk domain-containing protein [Bacillota bacterium]